MTEREYTSTQAISRVTGLEAALDAVANCITELRNEVFYTRRGFAYWQYSNTATPPPGAGQLRTNTPVTNLYVHKIDTDGYNRETQLDFIVARTATIPDVMRIRVRGTSGSLFELRSNGHAVDAGDYYTIPVRVISGTAADKGFRVEVTFLSGIWAEDPPPLPSLLPA